MSRSKWQTIFSESFDAEPEPAERSDGGVNLNTWAFDLGTRDTSDPAHPGPEGWGNNEPQYYTDRQSSTGSHVSHLNLSVQCVPSAGVAAQKHAELQLAFVHVLVIDLRTSHFAAFQLNGQNGHPETCNVIACIASRRTTTAQRTCAGQSMLVWCHLAKATREAC